MRISHPYGLSTKIYPNLGGRPGYEGEATGYRGGKTGYEGGRPGYEGGRSGYEGGKTGYRGGKIVYEGGKIGYEGDACLHDTLCVVVVLVIMHGVLMGRNRMKFLAMYISVRANLKN